MDKALFKGFAQKVSAKYTDLRWRRRNWTDRLLHPPMREALAVTKARSSARPLLANNPTRLLIDVSVIAKHDAGTGIQRVVRSIRNALPNVLHPDVAVEQLVVQRLKDGYETQEGTTPEGSANTIFLGLDFATDSVVQAQAQLKSLRAAGTPLWFLVHDVLPMQHPDWFTPASQLKYRRWMRTCAALADGFLCVSPDTSTKLRTLLTDRYRRKDLPSIITITPGSDIKMVDTSVNAHSTLPFAELDRVTLQRAVLIVGTLEPRKGHADALAAFEILWQQGFDLPLVLIGRPGWNTVELQKSIRSHNQLGSLLFWFENVDDEQLHVAYRLCGLTLVPSLGEGYGLPIDEALALGSQVLARDISVFQRHQAGNVQYFDKGASPKELAEAIQKARLTFSSPRQPVPMASWYDTAIEVARALGFNTYP